MLPLERDKQERRDGRIRKIDRTYSQGTYRAMLQVYSTAQASGHVVSIQPFISLTHSIYLINKTTPVSSQAVIPSCAIALAPQTRITPNPLIHTKEVNTVFKQVYMQQLAYLNDLILWYNAVSQKLQFGSSSQNGCCDKSTSAVGRSKGFLSWRQYFAQHSAVVHATYTWKQSIIKATANGPRVS